MDPLVTHNTHGSRHVPNTYCICNVHTMLLAILQQILHDVFRVLGLAKATQTVVASQCLVPQCHVLATRARVSFDETPWRGLLFLRGVDQNWRHACRYSSQSSMNAQNTCLQMSFYPTIQPAPLFSTVQGKMEDTFGRNSKTSIASEQHTSQSINSKAPKPHAPLHKRHRPKNRHCFPTNCSLKRWQSHDAA